MTFPPNEDKHRWYRSNYVYRGMADSSWGLETSLYRMGSAFESVEGTLLRSFKKYAETGGIPGDSLWIRLSVAQHHGLPTSLLDWTHWPRKSRCILLQRKKISTTRMPLYGESIYSKSKRCFRMNLGRC
ncbi:MAG: FRG domain-containing protein [Methylobacter sp.]